MFINPARRDGWRHEVGNGTGTRDDDVSAAPVTWTSTDADRPFYGDELLA